MYSTLEGAKKSAKSLHRLFDESGFIYPLSKCQLAIAKAGGFQHWHDLESNLTTARQPAAAEAYRRRLIAALPESCRNPVRAWFADEPPPDPPIEGYPARWYRDVYPYLAAVTKLHRRTPLLRPGSGRGQQLRELLVYELLLNLKGGAQPPPRLEADTQAFCFRGDLEAHYPEQIRHPDFERELARLVEAKILDWRFGMIRVLPPAGDVEAEVRERKAGMAQYWTETSGEAGDHERLMALREALAAIGVNHALRIAGAIILILLYLTFRRWDEALLIMATLPFALTGGLWLLYLLGYNQSVASAVGFIALAGVAAEFGVVMLIYLKHALADRSDGDILAAVREGALLRVRPKAMTVAVILAGLFPILVGTGTGSEVMSRIAAPMIGGMLTAPLLSMLIIPAAYLLMSRRAAKPVQPEGEKR